MIELSKSRKIIKKSQDSTTMKKVFRVGRSPTTVKNQI